MKQQTNVVMMVVLLISVMIDLDPDHQNYKVDIIKVKLELLIGNSYQAASPYV